MLEMWCTRSIDCRVLLKMQDVAKKPSRRSQAERTASTSARLIAATISLLHEKGYAATSTTLVAERAGVSRGAMLHHFPTKVHLMAATIYATYENDIAAYEAVLADGLEGIALLDALMDAAWSCFKSPGGIAQTEIWMSIRSDSHLAAAVLPVHSTIMRRSATGLKAVLGSKLTDNTYTAEQVLTYLVSALRGLALQQVLGSPPDELERSVRLVKSTIYALIAPKP
jgi:AcrR family transcriptional regulator